MFEVVEQKQHRPVPDACGDACLQIMVALLAQAEGPGNRRWNERDIGHESQVDEAGTGESISRACCQVKSQACLANTTWPGQGQQADIGTVEQSIGCRLFTFSPQDRGGWNRES